MHRNSGPSRAPRPATPRPVTPRPVTPLPATPRPATPRPGTGAQPVVLHRGVPAVRWIYSDRATSVPGCQRPGRPVREGAYTAIAFDGQLSSQVLVFLLGRPDTFLP